MIPEKKIIIKGSEYIIKKSLSFQWPQGDYRAKYKYFQAETSAWPFHCFLANYGDYWGAGENFYDAADALDASMFSASRKAFMAVIDGNSEIVLKTK